VVLQLGVGKGANNALQKLASLQNGIIFHGLVLIRWYNLSNGKWTRDLVHGRIILRWKFRKCDGRAWSRMIWPG
jgi:hypothetical protein